MKFVFSILSNIEKENKKYNLYLLQIPTKYYIISIIPMKDLI